MTPSRKASVGVALVLFLALGTAHADDRSELLEVEIAVAKARRRIPPPSEAVNLQQYLREKAEKAKVAIELIAAPPTPMPPSLELQRLDVSGSDELGNVQYFLALASNERAFRIVGFESLQLTAESSNRVSFLVRVAMACWTGEPPPSASIHERLVKEREILDAIKALDERFQPRRIVVAVGELEREIRDKAIALTELRSGDDTRLDGVVLGALARETLKPALEKSGFKVAAIDFTPRGDCQAFSATARLEARDRKMAFVTTSIFDGDTFAICTPKKTAPPLRVAAHGSGNVTMHLRDIDATDVFAAMNAATKEGFMVSSDVTGRFDVDFESATPEQALAALKAAGLPIGPGPLHLVGASATMPAGHYTGEPISMTLHDADTRDITRVFEQLSGRKVAALPARRVSIFVIDEPWDSVFAAIPLLRGGPAKADAARREWWAFPHLDDLAVRDLRLAGVANTAEGWVAYAYIAGAARKVVFLKANQPLHDAKVATIDAHGVTFDNGVKLDLR